MCQQGSEHMHHVGLVFSPLGRLTDVHRCDKLAALDNKGRARALPRSSPPDSSGSLPEILVAHALDASAELADRCPSAGENLLSSSALAWSVARIGVSARVEKS